MKRVSLFGHVIELHDLVRTRNRPADVVADEFFRARRYLGASDRRFIRELLFGLLRHFRLVHFYAEEAFRASGGTSHSSILPAVALIGTYAMKLGDEPADSLLPDLGGLWRVYVTDADCARFLDALTRVTLPDGPGHCTFADLAVRFSLPDLIVREWIERYGPDETELLCAAMNSPAPTTVRVNTLVTTVDLCRSTLTREGIEARPTALSPFGLRLSKRINAQSLHSFQQGFFEIQDEGSQLISVLAGARPGSMIIDACAGGGGKTLHLAALMGNQGTLLSVDVDENRLHRMGERLERAGITIAQRALAQRDGETIRQWAGRSDAVLVDAPCSGVGTFRRNPGAKITFTDALVDRMAATQRTVLEEYAGFVKIGGRLVYSTCTLLKKENEEQVESFLSRHPEFELLSAPEVLSLHHVRVESSGPYLTLLPHHTNTDGFFAAVMSRHA